MKKLLELYLESVGVNKELINSVLQGTNDNDTLYGRAIGSLVVSKKVTQQSADDLYNLIYNNKTPSALRGIAKGSKVYELWFMGDTLIFDNLSACMKAKIILEKAYKEVLALQ